MADGPGIGVYGGLIIGALGAGFKAYEGAQSNLLIGGLGALGGAIAGGLLGGFFVDRPMKRSSEAEESRRLEDARMSKEDLDAKAREAEAQHSAAKKSRVGELMTEYEARGFSHARELAHLVVNGFCSDSRYIEGLLAGSFPWDSRNTAKLLCGRPNILAALLDGQYDHQTCKAMAEGKPASNMDENAVLLMWGEPDKIGEQALKTKSKKIMTWYGERANRRVVLRTATLENGALAGWEINDE